MKANENKCIIKNCDNWSYIRGLCQNCYATALDKVTNKQTTWDELEKLEMAKKNGESVICAECSGVYRRNNVIRVVKLLRGEHWATVYLCRHCNYLIIKEARPKLLATK